MRQAHTEIDIKCPECKGNGFYIDYDINSDGQGYEKEYECPACKGTGLITNTTYNNGEFERR